MNAKVGEDNTEKELIMGKRGVDEQNENGELFTDFCSFNDLVIGGIVFPHKKFHKTTCVDLPRWTNSRPDRPLHHRQEVAEKST